ncbi:MAG: chemotaxis protein CheW [Pseudomonadota bacterium]
MSIVAGLRRLPGDDARTRELEAVRAAHEVKSGTEKVAHGNASLSQRTEEQASSLEETASSTEEMTSTVKQNADGAKLIEQSGATLTEIVGAVKKVADIVAEIAAASLEQSAGIEQVDEAVMSIDEATQQNAALVEAASAAAVPGEVATTGDGHGQVLSFSVATELYGVPILSVQEIRGWERATVLPRSAEHVRGVINLRGQIVRVLDVRRRDRRPVA